MKPHTFLQATATVIMFSRSALSFVSTRTAHRAFHSALRAAAKEGQAEVILVGCGAPNRGMGWYHGIQVRTSNIFVGIRSSKIQRGWMGGHQ